MKINIPTITVDPELRELILPSEKLVLGINGDVEVNAVQFQLPLAYRELELKRLIPRINYVNPNGDVNYYESTMESDESNCYFIWPITPDITAYTGHVRFSLTLYQTEGDNILHKFNTRSATGRVYTGFEAEKQVTPEQQQTLLSKLETQIKADLNDHTEKLKNQLTEKGKEILDSFGESGSVSEELKAIKQDLGTKLTAPPTPEVGKILKIKSVNEDGTFVCEWADDGGSNLDVRINGQSIVQDGVAEIPIATQINQIGLMKLSTPGESGLDIDALKRLIVSPTNKELIAKRHELLYSRNKQAVATPQIDDAVKAAMCDGKGAAWTAEEQAAARERMGLYGNWQLKSSFTLENPVAYIDILDNLNTNEVYLEGSDFLLCDVDGTPISGSNKMSIAVNDVAIDPTMMGNVFGTQYKTSFYAYIKRIKNVILVAIIYGNTSIWKSSGNILSNVRTLRGDRMSDDNGKIRRIRIANAQYNTYHIQSGATINVYTR